MKPLIFAASLALVAAGGAALGYIWAREQLGREFDTRLEQEIAAAKKHYRQAAKVEEFATPSSTLATLRPEVMDAAKAVMVNYSAAFDSSRVDPPIKTTKNIFSSQTIDVSLENEKRKRTEEAPYVLTKDEYMEGDLNYQQITLTYFEGDKTLVDEQDDMVEDSEVDALVGLNNLNRFGAWSEDDNIVYIRNHVKEFDIEVSRHGGKFSVIGLGIEET